MKKFLLLFSFCVLAVATNAQVIFYVEAPSPNEGNYDFTYADAADWDNPDFEDPLSAVSGVMVLVDDGTGDPNPEACDDIINDLTGKVAVLYRGDCEFGVKALNAQEAGAIAVVMINNLAGAPVAMGGGADGPSVSIPVVMITAATGALLRDEIDTGETSVFIGSKNGLYSNDIGMRPGDMLRAQRFGNVQSLSQSAAEFEVEVGSWVRNYGSNDQTGVVLKAEITLGGSTIYSESSDPASIESGDSVYIPLPTFSQASYANGYYNMSYNVSIAGVIDESSFDNVQVADFTMSDDMFSLSRLDESSMVPINETNQFNGTTTTLFSCLTFQDPNASRVAVNSVNYSAGTSQNPEATTIEGEAIEFWIIEWEDEFDDLDDADFNMALLNDVYDQGYEYTDNLQGENVNIPLEEPYLLEDDVRYLFCVILYGDIIYPGYDTKVDYRWNVDNYRQPVAPLQLSDQWFALGYGNDRMPAMGIEFTAPNVGLVELPETVELTAYPNPAQSMIYIPIELNEGNVAMKIVDINGRIVEEQNTEMTVNRLEVDVTGLAAGLYTINLEFANGERGSVKVVVSK
ncbi:T9SS type A sorting domain-containing protein [Crocinitomix catalasitica]|uniref:T9SS type A sorting domain-containing protein n=1 Tax=Crocinitomix catalasitica TaxID=184607 RepID=UPI000487E9BC|nr:T9SS type A sorting domain-containing protein [Crocinitomix catalasitica]